MAQDVLAFTMYDYEKGNKTFPKVSDVRDIHVREGEFVNYVLAETEDYKTDPVPDDEDKTDEHETEQSQEEESGPYPDWMENLIAERMREIDSRAIINLWNSGNHDVSLYVKCMGWTEEEVLELIQKKKKRRRTNNDRRP